MSGRGPEFEELVGSDLDATERDRLRRVHDLLVAAGPPPEISTASAPSIDVAPAPPRRGRRRRGALLAFATALGVLAAFAVGVTVADDDLSVDRVIALSGPAGASATLEIYELDDAGNWPMRIEVEGLAAQEDGPLYQLWLTKDGQPAALCGSFHVDDDGAAAVPMNAPWRLSDFDGWVVVEQGSKTPLLTT